MLTNEEKLKRIQQEQKKLEDEINKHEKALPVLLDEIFNAKHKLREALFETDMVEDMGKDDLEWLADDIIDHASNLASKIRKLSESC